jgi:hypothetical protein
MSLKRYVLIEADGDSKVTVKNMTRYLGYMKKK